MRELINFHQLNLNLINETIIEGVRRPTTTMSFHGGGPASARGSVVGGRMGAVPPLLAPSALGMLPAAASRRASAVARHGDLVHGSSPHVAGSTVVHVHGAESLDDRTSSKLTLDDELFDILYAFGSVVFSSSLLPIPFCELSFVALPYLGSQTTTRFDGCPDMAEFPNVSRSDSLDPCPGSRGERGRRGEIVCPSPPGTTALSRGAWLLLAKAAKTRVWRLHEYVFTHSMTIHKDGP